MTMPDQTSALSKEELNGLLGAGRKHAEDAQDSHGGTMGTAPNAPKTSSPQASAAAEADTAAENRADDLQMVLGHWERTVAGLQQELIELRSRVARLEQQLGEETARQTPPSRRRPGRPCRTRRDGSAAGVWRFARRRRAVSAVTRAHVPLETRLVLAKPSVVTILSPKPCRQNAGLPPFANLLLEVAKPFDPWRLFSAIGRSMDRPQVSTRHSNAPAAGSLPLTAPRCAPSAPTSRSARCAPPG
ncbi:hypothetical protein OMP38_28730 [Cohnella ginsengisoli]|uniref:Uncharacterized protein n=1 Tax=Cohnella ginsengisoli TaxID=425004 RepID=A0A9X4QQ99_9BACL|nr:hypothetical protein [Cohnella ginsengisoli]MDG0794377.1 hypothetical protein [Cohnella ginsengisoli]